MATSSMPSLARSLLRIVQTEAALAANSSPDDETDAVHRPLLQSLREFTASFATSASQEKSEVFSHYLRLVLRIMNRLRLNESPWSRSKAKDVVLVFHNTQQALASMLGQEAKQAEDVANLLFPTVIMLEYVRQKAAGGQFHAEEEELAEAGLGALLAQLQLAASTGPAYAEKTQSIWPQLTYILVNLASEKARSVCLTSMQCLTALLAITKKEDTAFVRSIFPGVFSAMYTISTHSKGSAVLCQAMTVMIALIAVVADKASLDNQRLSAKPNTLSDMLAAKDVSSSSQPKPVEGDDLAELRQWRVGLLQRLRQHFPTAFRTALGQLSTKHQEQIRQQLCSMLPVCYQYLGVLATQEMVLCVVSALPVADDACRASIASTLAAIRAADAMFAGQLQSALQAQFMSHLLALDRCHGTALQQELLLVINLAALGDLQVAVMANKARISATLQALLAVDIEDKHSMLEKASYHFLGGGSCTASYYKWRQSHDKECQALIRILVMQIGSYSDFGDELTQCLEKLQSRLSSRQIDIKRIKLDTSRATSLMLLMRNASFASRTYSIATEEVLACVVCGKPGSCCSRCKGVVYCSKKHQMADWKTHKNVCKPATSPALAARPVPCVQLQLVDPNTILHTDAVTGISHRDHMFLEAVKLFAKQIHTLLAIVHRAAQRYPEMVHYLHALLAVHLECIADVVYLYGVDSKPDQILALLPILQCAVMENAIVQQAARSSLIRLALYAGHCDLPSMLRDQMDYIVDFLCSSLRSLSKSQGLEHEQVQVHLLIRYVFSTCSIELTDASVLAPMYLLNDIITDCLDVVDQQATSTAILLSDLQQIVKVLHAFTLAIPLPVQQGVYGNKKMIDLLWLFHDKHTEEVLLKRIVEHAVPAVDIGKEIVSSLLLYDKNVVDLFAPFDESNETKEVAEEPEPVDDYDVPLTSNIQLLLTIITRSAFLINMDHPHIQQYVLHILANALLRLVGYEKYLLPSIHKMWATLSSKLAQLTATFMQRHVVQKVRSTSRLLEIGKPVSVQEARPVGNDSTLHLLPGLLDLVTLLCTIAPGFIVTKLKGECMPRVLGMLFVLQGQYQNSAAGAVSAADSHSLDVKTKLSLLAFVRNIIQENGLDRMLISYHKVLEWLIIPLCGANEVTKVQERAKNVFSMLTIHDPVYATALLRTIQIVEASKRDVAGNKWSMLAFDPQVFEAWHAHQGGKPSGLFGASKAYQASALSLFHRYQADRSIGLWAGQHLQEMDARTPKDYWLPSTTESMRKRSVA